MKHTIIAASLLTFTIPAIAGLSPMNDRILNNQYRECQTRVVMDTPGYSSDMCKKQYVDTKSQMLEEQEGLRQLQKAAIEEGRRKTASYLPNMEPEGDIQAVAKEIDKEISRHLILDPTFRGKSCTINVKTNEGLVTSVEKVEGFDPLCKAAIASVNKNGTLPFPANTSLKSIFEDFNINVVPSM